MLRISHDTLSPQEIGAALGVEETFSSAPNRSNVWFFVAQPTENSRDNLYHIDWLLRHFADRHCALRSLRKRGCWIEIICFWESVSGNGGPRLDRELLVDLAKFPMDRLGFDFRIDEPPWGSEVPWESEQQNDAGSKSKSIVNFPAPHQEYSPVAGRTYVTLRIYHNELLPQEISSRLNLKPDRIVRRGTPVALRLTAQMNGWFYSSEGQLGSQDVGLHLAWLARSLASSRVALQSLQERGSRMDISCFWESTANSSGPALSADLLTALAMLPIDEIWFDVYFDDSNVLVEDSEAAEPSH